MACRLCHAVTFFATFIAGIHASADENAARASSVIPLLTQGGVVMTFDDRNFADWLKALPLFDEFGVKATFFIHGKIDTLAQDAIRQLRQHGHAIGSHSVNHIRAVDYFEKNDPEAYLQSEVHPQMKEFAAADIVPVSFAYPMSSNNWATDETLLTVFRHLRTGRSIRVGQHLHQQDMFFVPASQIAEHRCLSAKGIDFTPGRADRTYEQINGALERAARKQEIIVLYAHQISENAKGNFVTPEALTRVFSKAKQLNLRFYTFDQLP